MQTEHWGRSIYVSNTTWLFVVCTIFFSPLFLFFMQLRNCPGQIITFDYRVVIGAISWILFQVVLSYLEDGIHRLSFLRNYYSGGIKNGPINPTGEVLRYKINGLQAWIISHTLYFLLVICGMKGSGIADNWIKLFLVAFFLSCILSILIYIKAFYYPTNFNDNKLTNSRIYDFFFGIEHNPRIGFLDFKLFFNGRPGIIAWTMINISFAFKQYENYGYVTDSMILVNILQAIYVIDFFWHENWYLHTIDIAHDHFGFYLAFGDLVWLPFFYTMQSVYLSNHPIFLGKMYFSIVLSIGIFGYIIFRLTNWQKDNFKKYDIAGSNYLIVEYRTIDGTIHSSKLLLSGMWGIARHMNYTGDLVLSLSYGLACGFDSIVPYLYFIFMFILLIMRCYRDEDKCLRKYGNTWIEYCKKVPYRLMPYVY